MCDTHICMYDTHIGMCDTHICMYDTHICVIIKHLLTDITMVKFQATEMLYHDSYRKFQRAGHGKAPGA